MKLSTLALAVLYMGTAHAQQAEFNKKVHQLRGAESSIPQPQGQVTDDIDQKLLAMCQQQDGTSCNSNEDCVWCECEAVPSSCFSKQAAHLLPDRVYIHLCLRIIRCHRHRRIHFGNGRGGG
mmetsp:Transcript_13417/g.22062  ORF Transcript_13417/g.22062 Transcript_13417/m.22062 type:complete len:122 (+) Transcript_13417:102-467(+)